MIPRLISSRIQKSPHSVLLLGPRQVGKSTLIRQLKPDLTLDLSDETLYIEFNANLDSFKERIEQNKYKTVFIDEIQRLPGLMNLIQYYIDQKRGLKFYLTGSSARKLKKGGSNLLPGRVLNYHLGPLVTKEVDYSFSTNEILSSGSLPGILQEKIPDIRENLLRSYSVSYLKEEIQQEALVRNLPSFARFFHSATHNVGQFIDYSKLAKAAKISRHAIPRYFEILEDTLVGSRVNPFAPCIDSASLVKHPKFYLFDCGVYNGLMDNFKVSHDRKGILMEQMILSQIRSSCWAQNQSCNYSSFRTRSGLEVDFIFEIDGEPFAIEVKAGDSVDDEDLRGLAGFAKYYAKPHTSLILHAGKKESKKSGIWCIPWQDGLKKMGL